MSHDRLYINDNYPLTTNVYRSDGVTPVLPLDATIDIVNQLTGDVVETNASCTVGSGLATYYILSGSSISQTSGRYVGYMRVQIDSNTAETIPIPFDVLDKRSYAVVERWRRKVEDSAPSDNHDDDEHGRDWVDQAVDYLNWHYDTNFTSVLGSITPIPSTNDIELIASVASLLARYAWWAGKGNWRDGEMSFNGTPFQAEFERLDSVIQNVLSDSWFSDTNSVDMYNRDKVYYPGVKYDSPDYWHRNSTDPDPDTEIPI